MNSGLLSVDVILLTYNAEHFISKTLDAILLNNYGCFRVIIVDDNSKDNTVKIIQSFQHKYPNFIDLEINEINIGVTANANKALDKTTADIVMFCGHDDLFYKSKIKECVRAFTENSEVSLVYHDCDVLVDGSVAMKYSDTHTPREGDGVNYLLYGCFSTATSVCVLGELARAIRFNEDVKNTSDFLFFYEVSKRGKIKYISKTLGGYVRHESNLTKTLCTREDFDSVKASIYILEHYKEDRIPAIINLNWTLLKLFLKNKKELLFYLFSPLISLLWIMGQKIGKKKIH